MNALFPMPARAQVRSIIRLFQLGVYFPDLLSIVASKIPLRTLVRSVRS